MEFADRSPELGLLEELHRSQKARVLHGGPEPFRPARVGAWWSGREEIDIVARSEAGRHLLPGERERWQRPAGSNVPEDLRRNAAHRSLCQASPAHLRALPA